MITFQEFQYNCNLILEKYYAPNEKLPSGRTPVKAAEKRGIKGSLLAKVKRGADNKEIDLTPQKGVKIKKHDNTVVIRHSKSGAEFNIRHLGNLKGKPHYELEWWNPSKKEKTPEEKRKFATTIKRAWYNNVQNTLPHGSVVSNLPASDTHAGIYSKKRVGFGKVIRNRQYATVGRMPSPRQQAKGKRTRLTPFNPT